MSLTTTTAASADYDEYYYDDIVRMTPGVQIPSAIGLGLLIFIAIGGNALTILAYIVDSKLHGVYNFYIFNLAITDLLLSCISMPFYAVYTLTEFTWPFGYAFCKVWLVVDFTLCFQSILLMLILSCDRLLLIILGTRYTTRMSVKLAGIQIAISWIVSFLVYSPAIIGWDHWVGYSTVEDMDCDVEFAYDFTYTTATAFIEFILPFVILTSLNTVIYCKIRQRNRIAPITSLNHHKSQLVVTGAKQTIPTVESSGNGIRNENETGNGDGGNTKQASGDKDGLQTLASQSNRNRAIERREGKAARLLAVLVVVFLLCWAPYTITTVIISFCDECVNTSLYEFFNWVLWIKSALNPLLYAYNSLQYRRNFLKLLTCKRRANPDSNDTSVNRTANTNV